MGLPQRGGPDFSMAGVLLLATFGAFLWKSVPLDSARPNGNEHTFQIAHSATEKISAKLWQDPFLAVDAHISSHRTSNKHQDISRSSAHLNSNNNDLELESGSTDAIRDCNLLEIQGHHESTLEVNVRVIATMLNRGAETEIVERRRSRRYAVVSALGQSGYIPQAYNTLSYCQVIKEDHEGDKPNYIIPYEWYVPDPLLPKRKTSKPAPPPADKILVMWIPEAYFTDHPFGRFKGLAKYITSSLSKKDKKPIIYFLGPARSDTLRMLASKALEEGITKDSFKDIKVSGLHILSPTATMVDELLAPGGYDDNTADKLKNLYKHFSPDQCNNSNIPCITFQRTIKTDDKLTDLLVDEITSRNNWNMPTGHVALISEWDTSFGRALPMTFTRSYCKKLSVYEDNPDLLHNCEKVIQYSYLRGIDGYIPGTDKNTSNTGSVNSASDTNYRNSKKSDTRVHRPTGTGRYDYLRRLALEIKQRDATLQSDRKGNIAAIGILGSDVYDKLLILRALRPQFPNIIFFTTDLDAQLLYPGEYRWTRNLVIASSFGLELSEGLQGKIPPFRNSYQTSIFFSTLLATKFNYPYQRLVSDPAVYSYEQRINEQSGLLYEVGRHSAVPLQQNNDKSNGKNVYQHNVDTKPGLTLLTLALLALLLIIVIHQVKPATGWLVIGLLLALLTISSVAGLALYNNNYPEPVNFSEGVSIWPTEFIRFGAFFLSVFFIIRMFKDLRNNCVRISRDFFNIKKYKLTNSNTLEEIWGSMKQKKPGNRRKTPVWLRDCSCALLASSASLPISAWYAITYPWIILLYWTLLLGLWFWRIKYVQFESINAWALELRGVQPVTDEISLPQKYSVKSYWNKYCAVGSAKNRIYRSMTMFLLYMAFATLVFLVLGFPQTPCRGSVSCNTDIVISMLGVPAMMLLIFFVLDELRLSIFWIKGLTRGCMSWESRSIKLYCNEFTLKTEAEKKWATMLLIAERTSEISRLIYYPFLIIIIMLLSRNSYFDNWGFPQGLAVIVSINIVLLIMSGIKLRQTAEAYRTEAVEYLSQKLFELTAVESSSAQKTPGTSEDKADKSDKPDKADSSDKQDTIDHLKEIIRHISELNDGIFQPFMNQPLVRASFLLIGAIGLTVGEYATLLN